MKININPDLVLLFYDVPILFVGINQVDTKYLCLLVDSIDNKARYLARPVTSDVIIRLAKKKIDLKQAFFENDVGCWLYLDTKDEEAFEEPSEIEFSSIPEKYLPKEGVFLNYSLEVDEKLIEDSYKKDKAIVCLSFEEGTKESVNAYTLSEVVNYFQSVVKYSYKKAMTEVGDAIKNLIDIPENYTLDAYASAPGSFKIYFVSNSTRGLFSGFDINYALDRINEIIADKDTDIIENLKKNQGHAIGNYSKLLESVSKNDINIKIEWIDPNEGKNAKKTIVPEYANRVLKIINARKELSKVNVELVGKFEFADTTSGNWRIVDDLGKTHSGIGNGDLLKDRVIYTRVYRLICEEIIEEENISGKEKKKYILNTIIDVEKNLTTAST